MSIRTALGCDGSPGMVRMSPQIGYTKPAPTEALTSRTGSFQPVGAPFSFGSDEMDRCVLAMQTQSLPKPLRSNESNCSAAGGQHSTPPPPYTLVATDSSLCPPLP